MEHDHKPTIKISTVQASGGGGGRFYGRILDTYGAPKLSQLTECRAPELPEWKHKMANVILNSIFLGIEFPPQTQRYILNFVRRLETAVVEYQHGRAELLTYVKDLPRRNNHFLGALRALSHFEQCAAALYQAAQLTPALTGQPVFKKGDGSPLSRLNIIYNRSKHFEDAAGVATPPATPVWLVNEGIECTEVLLTYDDLVFVLNDLMKCGDFVAIELPKLVEEKRRPASAAGDPERDPNQ